MIAIRACTPTKVAIAGFSHGVTSKGAALSVRHPMTPRYTQQRPKGGFAVQSAFVADNSGQAVEAAYVTGVSLMALTAIIGFSIMPGTSFYQNRAAALSAHLQAAGNGPTVIGLAVVWKHLGSKISATNYKYMKYALLGALLPPLASVAKASSNSPLVLKAIDMAMPVAALTFVYLVGVTFVALLKK